MNKFSNFICKHKVIVLILSFLLLIPSVYGYMNTKINYDILVYLPSDIETVKGQNLLKDEFHIGAFTIVEFDNSNQKLMMQYEDKIKEVDGVKDVVSINSVIGTTIPFEMLPDDLTSRVKKGDSSIMAILFDETTSDEKTLTAVKEIRNIFDNDTLVGGMSSIVLDTRDLANKEILAYIVIAVLLCLAVLFLTMDSYIVPILLLLNVGVAIVYNMGSNIFLNDISYITKAISAVLQLGVTMDFSIFLYHKYQSNKNKYDDLNKAMSKSIQETLTSVLGSALTTIAGFLALCSMNLTLGKDIGIVMAKGVLFGVICVITIFPCMLLVFDKLIEKTKHKNLLPKFDKLNNFIVKHYKSITAIFLLLLVPVMIGNSKVNIYYNLDKSLPDTLESVRANEQLKKDFNIVSPEIVILNNEIDSNEINKLTNELSDIKGIEAVLSPSILNKYGILVDMLDKDLTSMYKTDDYQLMLINSFYEVASPELTTQINEVNKVIKKYDKNALLVGEGPLTNDLIKISDKDFHNVNYVSIFSIFVIMAFTLKSILLPILLIIAIEFAIFVNVAISYYTGVTLPFIASIVIGTIQLGATIDYAILMTTKYLELRENDIDKMTAIKKTLNESVKSVFVSALCFFTATFGVSIYTDIDLIGSICTLISRGAIISMLVVVFVLPSILIIFDKYILKSRFNRKKEKNMNKKLKRSLALICLLVLPFNINAASKEETVYTNLNADGSVNKTVVSTRLYDISEGKLSYKTNLNNITNVSGDEKFNLNNNTIEWDVRKDDIYYKADTNTDLPISLNIKYYLDNKLIDNKDLIGKSGKVKIEINYTNNEKNTVKINNKKQTLYTPFLVTTITTLDKNTTKNVKINNGKIMDNGLNYMIMGISMPGMYDNMKLDEFKDVDKIVVEYDTTDYKFNSIYNIVSSNLLKDSDIDFSDLKSIYNNVSKLSKSSKQLVSGTKELNNGICEFTKYFEQFNNGMDTLNKTVTMSNSQLGNSIDKINNGVKNITEIKDLPQKVNMLSSSVNKLNDATTTIKNQSDNINNILTSTTSALENHINTLKQILATTTDENTKMLLMEELNNLNNQLEVEKIKGLTSNINELDKNVNALNQATTAFKKQTDSMSNDLNTLVTSISSIQSETNKLYQMNTKLTESINYLANSSNTLYKNINKIKEGSNTLNNGINKFDKEGITKINTIVNYNLRTNTDKIEKLISLSNSYDTIDIKNKNINSETKFIMIVNN